MFERAINFKTPIREYVLHIMKNIKSEPKKFLNRNITELKNDINAFDGIFDFSLKNIEGK